MIRKAFFDVLNYKSKAEQTHISLQYDFNQNSSLIFQQVFGAFCAGLWSDRHNKTYFGFGESYLFTLVPQQIKYPWVGQQQQQQSQLNDGRQYKVKRDFFLFVNNEKIIVGGGYNNKPKNETYFFLNYFILFQ